MTQSISFLNLACLALIITTSEEWGPMNDVKWRDHNTACVYMGRVGACKINIYEIDLDYICQHFFCASRRIRPGLFFAESVGKAPPGTPCGNATQVCNAKGECVNDPRGKWGRLRRDPEKEKECRLNLGDMDEMEEFYESAKP